MLQMVISINSEVGVISSFVLDSEGQDENHSHRASRSPFHFIYDLILQLSLIDPCKTTLGRFRTSLFHPQLNNGKICVLFMT